MKCSYLIRHSERIDFAYPNIWKNTKRYQENHKDPYITKNGILLVRKAMLKIINDIKNNDNYVPDYIYSSPFVRCIETSIVISSIVNSIFKKRPLIRIEYGLRELYVMPFCYRQLMDKKMTVEWILKRYYKHKHIFDTKYRSIHKFDEMQYNALNPLTEINRPLKVIAKLDGIICTHGLNILSLIRKSKGKLKWFENNKVTGKSQHSYCAMVKIE